MPAPRVLVAALTSLALVACTATPAPTTAPVTTPAATPSASASGSASVSTPSAAAAALSPDRQQLPLPHKDLPGMTTPPPGTGLARYLGQQVAWHGCERLPAMQCAEVLAPMDYAEPDGVAITLHIIRRPATGDRRGAMFVNPGGPGEPADGIVGARRWMGLPNLDIVGWDPRGTGQSTPVVCFPDQPSETRTLDALTSIDTSPDDEAEYQALVAASAGFAKSCAENSGEWLKYTSTVQTVQDMDLLRQLLGEEKLTYTGYSYGTWLGAVYATYYPDKVGRMVLDSAVDVSGADDIAQSEGFDRAMALFSQFAAKQGRLGKDPAAVVATVSDFLDRLDSQPLRVRDRDLTQTLAVMGIVVMLYGSEGEWMLLEETLVKAVKDNDGGDLLGLADSMNDRERNGDYGVRYASFPAIMCVDRADDGLSAGRARWGRDIARAPFFGRWFGPNVTCETWAVPPVAQVDIAAPASAPILVVGSTGDSATPYEYAGRMAEALGSGVLLTWDGPGHGSYGNGNACLDGAVNAYLIEGRVPAKGTTCKP